MNSSTLRSLTGHRMGRRELLRLLGGTAGLAALGGLGLPGQARAADYRALVCIFLFGGNDGFNMVVPTDLTRHNQYTSARAGLALPRSALLALDGSDYGLHPSMAALAPAWRARQLAPVLNVGPLAGPLTKTQYRAAPPGSPLVPDSLFSHADQQRAWEGATTEALARTGWGARAAETLATAYPVISLAGNCHYGVGEQAFALSLPGPGEQFAARGMDDPDNATNALRMAALEALQAPGQAGGQLAEHYATTQRDAFAMSERLATLVAGRPGDASVPAAIDRAFAHLVRDGELVTQLAAQLYQIAKLIAGRDQVQGDRHLYFAARGGFDTHADQVQEGDASQGEHAVLLGEVADAMAAFNDAMQALGLGSQVTAFTQSDFGRTYAANNSQGSDHAWGNIQLVCGGAVRGGATYGRYPTPVLGGPDDVGVEPRESQGRWIPAASVDQYAATLLAWLGATPGQLDIILPNLGAFGAERSLGFMSA
jgi:uncharacterized protein (DUF1501 family)